ncbi:hypothetical protein EJ02DRAFT_209898 [Clathrospora elynae]|uniref:Uncharacterized protein n=1 Tax=Clathrospora elynae TaxID=706981 RepID=A0A6A5SNR0_9PLEO|nr:hypothetical protein EJ02DRAFT_209898 [Clathrospora elynae]
MAAVPSEAARYARRDCSPCLRSGYFLVVKSARQDKLAISRLIKQLVTSFALMTAIRPEQTSPLSCVQFKFPTYMGDAPPLAGLHAKLHICRSVHLTISSSSANEQTSQRATVGHTLLCSRGKGNIKPAGIFLLHHRDFSAALTSVPCIEHRVLSL